MHLTQQTDYALRVLIYTAINDDGLVNIADIAHDYNISKSHLMKVVTMLVKGGFLYSVRGKGGGLRLGQPPEKIRIGDVVRLTEPLAIVECFSENNQCIISHNCRLMHILHAGVKLFLSHLDGYTLADLINRDTQKILYRADIDKISLHPDVV